MRAFIRDFVKSYRGHGGIVTDPNPIIIDRQTDGAKAVTELFTAVGNKNNARPQMLMFILPTRSPDMYNRIKKSADCRYGVVSQCLQGAQVTKNSPQYHSNVCMKFNAKLGGTTSRVQMVGFIEIGLFKYKY